MTELYSDLGEVNSNLIGYFDGSSYNNIDDAVRACVDSLPNSNNITYFRTILKNSLYKAIIQKYVNSDFAFAVVFSYVSKTIQCYRKIDGRWENTESLITKSDLTGTGNRTIIKRTQSGQPWLTATPTIVLEGKSGVSEALVLASFTTKDGTWSIGTQSNFNALHFQYKPNSGAGVTYYLDPESKVATWSD